MNWASDYIAIVDNIGIANGLSDLVSMKDLFNEWHAKNTRQKVRNVFENKCVSGVPLLSIRHSDIKSPNAKTNRQLVKKWQRQSKEYSLCVLRDMILHKLQRS